MLLSKSRFIQYQQCPKLCWMSTHDRIVLPAPAQQDDSRQQEGREVEKYAHGLFQNATQINKAAPLAEILAQSRQAVLRPIFNHPIFNPIIQAGGLIAEIDILLPVEDGTFHIYEIKSSTAVQDQHIPDVAFQVRVCQQAGINISRSHILTINNTYVRRGSIRPKKLFHANDITEAIHSLNIMPQIKSALELIGTPRCPKVKIGAHCDAPYECPLKEVCWKKVNDHPCNVFTITRLQGDKKWALYNQGIIKNADIPIDYKLMPRQKIQIECEKTGQMHIGKKGLKEFLDGLVYPLYFLDFETIAPAVPMLDGTKPYQQIPFQFSLHRLESPTAEPCSTGWIWNGSGDVWLEMLAKLEMSIGRIGLVVAYNAGFEKAVLIDAAARHPKFQNWVDGLLKRFVDLLVPFRNFMAYHPEQHGSASLKAVLPAWTGTGYDCMAIQNGEAAGWAFRRLLESGDAAEREEIRRGLLEYCGQDTMGMVLVLRELRGCAC